MAFNSITGLTDIRDENGWSWDNLKVNGINVEEAIKYGALSNGDIFHKMVLHILFMNNQPRIYLNSSTIKKLESLNIKIHKGHNMAFKFEIKVRH